jgi:homoserine kinase
MVTHADAVFNVQRSALFIAALESGRYDLLAEAMQDRLHQTYRQDLVPGLGEILSAPRLPGMLAVALSGSGPTVIALATERFDEIGAAIAAKFQQKRLKTTIRHLAAAPHGVRVTERFKADE